MANIKVILPKSELDLVKFKPIDVLAESDSENIIIRTPSPVKKMLLSVEPIEGVGYISVQNEVKYYDTGMKILQEEKMLRNGKLHGVYKRWHMNGMLCEESLYDNGKLNGKQCYYSIDGKLTHAFNFADGIIDGKQMSYYTNGKIMSKMYYKYGIPFGERSFYYDSGTLKSLETYNENGLLTGTARTWHPNGRIARDATYIDGKLHGMYFEYNEDDLPILALYLEHGALKARGI